MTGEVFETVFDVVFDAVFEDVFELVFEDVFELVFDDVFCLGLELPRLIPERVKTESFPDPKLDERLVEPPVLWVCVRPFSSTVLAAPIVLPRLS